MSEKTTRLKMNVSIASEHWAFQPGQIVQVDSSLARKWISAGHAVRTAEPLTAQRGLLEELTAAETLLHTCAFCDRRARFVLKNRALCQQHFRSEMEG